MMPAPGDDQMVEHRYAEQRTRTPQRRGHDTVGTARRRVAARMVVADNDGNCVAAQCGSEDIARLEPRRVDGPHRDRLELDRAVTRIKEQHHDLLATRT